MAKPPVNPIVVNDTPTDYFQHLTEMVKPNFEEVGIKLNFSGYKETILEYASLKDSDTDKAWQLARDLNMWSEYFSDISNITQKLLLDSETTKIEQIAISSFESDNVKVANGDRLANKDERVVNARRIRNAFKSFFSELEAKVDFLERAYYHCKNTCEWNNQSRSKDFPI